MKGCVREHRSHLLSQFNTHPAQPCFYCRRCSLLEQQQHHLKAASSCAPLLPNDGCDLHPAPCTRLSSSYQTQSQCIRKLSTRVRTMSSRKLISPLKPRADLASMDGGGADGGRVMLQLSCWYRSTFHRRLGPGFITFLSTPTSHCPQRH